MTYKFFKSTGEMEEVNSVQQARLICGDFIGSIKTMIDEVKTVSNADDKVFSTVDTLLANWNHNLCEMERLLADPSISFIEKKKDYLRVLREIHSTCFTLTQPSSD